MKSPDSEENDALNSSTIRIRFIIGNNNNNNNHTDNSINRHQSGSSGGQNVKYCDYTSFTGQDETNQIAHQVIVGDEDNQIKRENLKLTTSNSQRIKSFRFIEPQNHKSALFVNLGAGKIDQEKCQIDDNNQENNSNNSKRIERQLFISPDLQQVVANCELSSASSDTTTSSTGSSVSYSPREEFKIATASFDDSASVFELIEPEDDPSSSSCVSPNPDGTMNHCNFMSWMPTARRQASTTTNPAADTSNKSNSASSDTFRDLTSSTTVGSDVSAPAGSEVKARRASSSDGLNQSMDTIGLARSASRNHLAICDSVETVCEIDQTQVNRFPACISYEERVMAPLEVKLESLPFDDFSPELSVASHIELVDDKECEELEAEVRYWEQKVEEMERKQFAEDAPRTLVENIIKHRKELRDLEFLSFQRMLESEESDRQSCEEKISHIMTLCDSGVDHPMSPSDNHNNPCQNGTRRFETAPMLPARDLDVDTEHHRHQRHQRRRHIQEDYFITDFSDLGSTGGGSGHTKATNGNSGKFGSQIKPGQENTADILNAVPPSGSLQHRQYLSKASSGTDSSEYSQFPTFDLHKHRVVHHHQLRHQQQQHTNGDQLYAFDESNAPLRNHRQHQRNRHQHPQNQQLQSPQGFGRFHQQSYTAQVDACSEAAEVLQEKFNRVKRVSPIRPDHFKGEFRQIKHVITQDSSSPASSSNES